MVDDRERSQGIQQGGGGIQHGEPQQAPGRNPVGDHSTASPTGQQPKHEPEHDGSEQRPGAKETADH